MAPLAFRNRYGNSFLRRVWTLNEGQPIQRAVLALVVVDALEGCVSVKMTE